MLFTNPWYFAFLALVLLALAPAWTVETKKRILALLSCRFYSLWDVRHLGLLLAISLIDFVCAQRMSHSPHSRKRLWLWLSVTSNLGILAFFKYHNFFIDNLNGLLRGVQLAHAHILLPAGISFYTFKTMSYVIDVYRERLPPVRSWMDYATFITFFPELIAGPIVRASVLLPQLNKNIGPTRERLAVGASLFLVGFTKKLIADRVGSAIDPVFADPGTFSCLSAWLALLGYAMQIYCDFAGYSDMAIGSARMIGYDLPENFRLPYLSGSVTEFWRRWHITLSHWLRDYLYIPLGGNRAGARRTYLNLALTMLLGGLWHGASWTFVIWGALHGVALAIERAFRDRVSAAWLPRPLAVTLTFFFVTACWIPFRCQTFPTALAYAARMLDPVGGLDWVDSSLLVLLAVVALGHAAGAMIEAILAGRPAAPVYQRILDFLGVSLLVDPLVGWHLRFSLRSLPAAYFLLSWVLLDFLLVPASLNPFIYFQF